jgi:hypothetical protein
VNRTAGEGVGYIQRFSTLGCPSVNLDVVAIPSRISLAWCADDFVAIETKALWHCLHIGGSVAIVLGDLDGVWKESVGCSVFGLVHEHNSMFGRLDALDDLLALGNAGPGTVARVVGPVDHDQVVFVVQVANDVVIGFAIGRPDASGHCSDNLVQSCLDLCHFQINLLVAEIVEVRMRGCVGTDLHAAVVGVLEITCIRLIVCAAAESRWRGETRVSLPLHARGERQPRTGERKGKADSLVVEKVDKERHLDTIGDRRVGNLSHVLVWAVIKSEIVAV